MAVMEYNTKEYVLISVYSHENRVIIVFIALEWAIYFSMGIESLSTESPCFYSSLEWTNDSETLK